MKLKEVCAVTGLSRKTIRLYEEKGLLIPRKEMKNGREYRDYSPEDVQQLKNIATLRRAWFTMEEIRTMQDHPESIQDIFPQYRQWLYQQRQDLDKLLHAAEQIDVSSLQSLGQLTEQISGAADALPMPKYDVVPHFLYLDKMESEIKPSSNQQVTPDWETPLEGGISDKRIYRQLVANCSRSTADDLAVAFGQAREARAMFSEDRHGLVQDAPIEDAPTVRAAAWVLTLLMILSGMGLLIFVPMGAETILIPILWAVLAVSFALRVALGIFASKIRKEKQLVREVQRQRRI